MSKLAQKLALSTPEPLSAPPGPRNRCFPLYGLGDLEDWDMVEAKREIAKATWREVQIWLDKEAGVDKPLPLEKFKYHWRRRCYCWPEDLRLS